MPDEKVELLRRAYEGWGKGDPEPVLQALDPHMEWDFSPYPLPDHPERGTGRDNYLQFLAEFSATWARHEIACTEFIPVNDEVVVLGIHERMEAGGGALSLERDIAHACTFRDGRVVLVRAYRSTDDALRAVGHTE